MRRSFAAVSVMAALLGGPALAQPMSQEQLVATIQALQARVDALEARSRRDQAELRAVKGPTRRVVREPAPVAYASALAAVPAPVSGNGFDGLYGAVIGGYQFGLTQRTKNGASFFGSFADSEAASGGNIGAAIGYNAISGPLLIGTELRLRKLFDEVNHSAYFQTYAGSPSYSFINTPVRERYAREYGGDLSLRAGFVWAENLLYTRIGGGADSLSHVYQTTFNGLYYDNIIRVRRETIASPYALIGIGVERNFGPWFARIEGAFLDHFEISPNTYARNSYFTTEVSSAIGYRF